jgi:hypothetical protein
MNSHKEKTMTDIIVKNVDVNMLRAQRNAVLDVLDDVSDIESFAPAFFCRLMAPRVASLEGLVNLLDAMLDNAEGFGD